MAKRKIVPLILILVGVAFLLGAIITWLDNLTATQPVGLGKWIFDILVALVGASSGIKGWLDWNKKETPAQVTNITARDSGQVATGEQGRNIQTKEYVEQNIEHYHEAPKTESPVLRSLHQLPPAPADFTGRETMIQELLKDFDSHKGATISGLTGMGGIGKTALGLVVAHGLKDKYPDAQIYIDLKGTTTPLSALDAIRQIILALEPQMDIRTLDETNMIAAYQTVLGTKQILLFLDNARSAEQIAPLRPPETCAMLVTSRWTFPVAGLKAHKLGVLPEQEAVDFLLELCPRINSKASDLAKACAYLPLALRIAGSFLQVNDDWSVDNYLQQLSDRKQRLETFKQSITDSGLATSEPDLQATFELSYNQLSEKDQKRWRMLGVFSASFGWLEVAAMWNYEEAKTTKTLSLLRRYSLLDYDETSERYSLHDLLTVYALLKMDHGEEQDAYFQHADVYLETMRAINSLYIKGGENSQIGLRWFDLAWDNIRSAHIWITNRTDQSSQLAELVMYYPDAAAFCLNLRLTPRERILWLKTALNASQKLKRKDMEEFHLINLGLAYIALGDTHKAIEQYMHALIISKEISDDAGKRITLVNLGNAYLSLRQPLKAIEYYNEYLNLGGRGDTGRILSNLGTAYADLGDGSKAKQLYEQALAFDRESGDRGGEGRDLSNLGTVYAELNLLPKAVECFEQALLISHEMGNRGDEGNALGNLGIAYYNLGNNELGIELTRKALIIFEEIESPDALQAIDKLKKWGALE